MNEDHTKLDEWPRLVYHGGIFPWRIMREDGRYVRRDGTVATFTNEQVARQALESYQRHGEIREV